MTSWKTVGIGAVLLPIISTAAVFSEKGLLLLTGVATGLVVSLYVRGGILSGLWHGLLTGIAGWLLTSALLVALAGAFVQSDAYVPRNGGIGWGVYLGILFAGFLGLQCLVGGFLGGLLSN